MMKKNLVLTLILMMMIVVFSCSKEEIATYDCSNSTPTYTNDIKAILDASCAYAGCHGGSNPSDGIDLSNYAESEAESTKNRFLGSIQHLGSYAAMPEGASKLDDATIELISCWVQNGSPE